MEVVAEEVAVEVDSLKFTTKISIEFKIKKIYYNMKIKKTYNEPKI